MNEQDYIDKFVDVFIAHWMSNMPDGYIDHENTSVRALAKTIAQTICTCDLILDCADEVA